MGRPQRTSLTRREKGQEKKRNRSTDPASETNTPRRQTVPLSPGGRLGARAGVRGKPHQPRPTQHPGGEPSRNAPLRETAGVRETALAVSRIRGAGLEQLEGWTGRNLDAPPLTAVFEEHRGATLGPSHGSL